jgi:replicative DNA helicase
VSKDLNDQLQTSEGLPSDPTKGTRVVSADVPRVLTIQDLLLESRRGATEARARSLITTGIGKLDAITGGLLEGFMWIFGASTGWGKSSLSVMLADENLKAKKPKRTMIVSVEDSERIYGDRLMCRRARVSADRLRKRRLQRHEVELITDVANRGEDMPVFLDARGKGVEWTAQHTKRIIAEQQIDLVIFDYLQAFDNEKPQQDRRNQINYIARTLTDIVKNARGGTGIAGIIMSQITETPNKLIPDKYSIRESKDVAHAGEVVVLGFTPIQDILPAGSENLKGGEKPEPIARKGLRHLYVDKVKNGPRGAILPLDWDEESACFNCIVDPEEQRLQELYDRSGADDFATDELERYP